MGGKGLEGVGRQGNGHGVEDKGGKVEPHSKTTVIMYVLPACAVRGFLQTWNCHF